MQEDEDPRQVIDRAYDRGGLKTPGFMSLIGSFEGYIMIYKDTKLAWTTKLSNVPIFLMRTKIADVNGLILSLSDNGYLSLNFLGTEKESQAELAKQF